MLGAIWQVASFFILFGLTSINGNNLFEARGDLNYGYVLKNQVISSFYNQSCIVDCIDKCEANGMCQSFNWFKDNGLCETNCGTHLSHAESLVLNSGGQYFIYGFRPATTCSNNLCNSTMVCSMVHHGYKNFKCHGMHIFYCRESLFICERTSGFYNCAHKID